MKKIKMKIVGFDKESYSLLVAFCDSDCKYNDPEQYPAYAFQPLEMWPDVRDLDEIKRRIAISGIYTAQQQAKKEQVVDNSKNEQLLLSMVGEEDEYIIDELLNNNNIIKYTKKD